MGWENANPWTVQDVEYLKSCHGKVTIDEAAEHLKREKLQVYTKMRLLSLQFKTDDPPGGMIWRQSLYTGVLASEIGLLWSVKRRRLIQPRVSADGELMITPAKGVAITVSRVVYGAFFSEIPKGYIVLRKDKDPSNCDIGNLICMSRQEARAKGLWGIRYPVAVYRDGKRIRIYPSTVAAAEAFGVSYKTIQYHIEHPDIKPIGNGKKMSQYEFKYLNKKKQAAGRNDVLARKKRFFNDNP